MREGLSFTLTANSKDDNTIAIVDNSYSSPLGFSWTWNISLYIENGKHFKKAGIGYFYRKRDAQSYFAQLEIQMKFTTCCSSLGHDIIHIKYELLTWSTYR